MTLDIVPPQRYWLPAPTGFPVEEVRRDFPALHRSTGGRPTAWLDNAATTHKPRPVLEALDRFHRHENSNIHRGAHAAARHATARYEGARERVAEFLGAAHAEEIVFTRGATEAINLVAQSYGRAHLRPGDEVVATTLEHHSNIVPWQLICDERRAVLHEAPIDDSGEVDLGAFARLLGPRTKIVAVSQVSNLLGTVPPVRRMAELAHAHGAVVVVDGAQAVAHLPIDVRALGADCYAFSGHKLFGPTGIGALYARRDLLEDMPPWQGGGGMIDTVSFRHTTFAPVPARFEAGTPPIAGAIGLAAAVDYLASIDPAAAWAHEQRVHAHARRAMERLPGLRMLGRPDPQVGVLTCTVDGVPPEHVAAALDRAGIMVRAGHHCAQPTLAHFGLTSAVRPSLALYNTRAEVDRLVDVLSTVVRSGTGGRAAPDYR
ncbi:cysteine desulfurase [Nocardia sp. BMG51109]|uniref:cysteine desulfurase n=1 Tax=Nocardia sp. BMG51109 TaxID=1056816 RepID=UPI0004643695|nr:cysteine desulfurase [Nocardia sp. BMG51109]